MNMQRELINRAMYRKIESGVKYNHLMPSSDCSSISLGKGNTIFGVENMLSWVKKYSHHTKNLAPYLKGATLFETCKNIKNFSYNHFQYKIDDYTQQLRSPACSWATRKIGIDCKSYSIFVSSILINLGIPHYFRQIKQPGQNTNNYTHVYVVVPIVGRSLSKGYYPIDGVIAEFEETPFFEKNDVYVSAPASRSYLVENDTETLPIEDATKPGALTVLNKGMGGIEELPTQMACNLNDPANQQDPEKLIDCILANALYQIEAYKYNRKQDTMAWANGIGSVGNGLTQVTAAGLYASGVGAPIAILVSACGSAFHALSSFVGAIVASFQKPCAGAEYMPKDVAYHLKNNFLPEFKRCYDKIKADAKRGALSACIGWFNEMLKEIDLGVKAVKNLKDFYNGNTCAEITIVQFAIFADAIKTVMDANVEMLEPALKEAWDVKILTKKAFTNDRRWYFIAKKEHGNHYEEYREISIKKHGINERIYIDFTTDFDTWAQSNKYYLSAKYSSSVGDGYYREIQQIKSVINSIDVGENVVLSDSKYENIREISKRVYLKYDTEYAQKVDKDFKDKARKLNLLLEKRITDFKIEMRERYLIHKAVQNYSKINHVNIFKTMLPVLIGILLISKIKG